MITLYKFRSRAEAEIGKSILEDAGIPSIILTDDSGGMRPHMAFSNGVDLRVHPQHLETAKKLLSEIMD